MFYHINLHIDRKLNIQLLYWPLRIPWGFRMKLAEALLERAEISKRISDLQSRLHDNAVYQEGDQPQEDPQALFDELLKTYDLQNDWNRRINTTNNNTPFDGGLKICDALALRDSLDKQIRDLTSTASHFTIKSNRYSKTEIKMIASMNPKVIRDHVVSLQTRRKELDRKLQMLNWSVEVAA